MPVQVHQPDESDPFDDWATEHSSKHTRARKVDESLLHAIETFRNHEAPAAIPVARRFVVLTA